MNETKIGSFIICVLYGIVIPAFLVFLASTSYFKTSSEAKVIRLKNTLENNLDIFLDNYDSEKFFHKVFLNQFKQIDNTNFSQEKLSRNISKLKNSWPGKLTFVALNKKGKIINALSDKIRSKFAVKISYKALKKLSNFSNDLSVQQIELEVPFVAQKINILRAFLGTFLTSNQLLKPLLDETRGSCIFADRKKDKGMTWFYSGKNFSIFIFLHQDLKRSAYPISGIINSFNGQKRVGKIGACNLVKGKFWGINGLNLKTKNLIKKQQYEFENNFYPFLETDKFILHYRQPLPELVLFSFLDKSQHIQDYIEERNIFLFKLIKFLAIFVFISFCYSLRKKTAFLSVKQKLTALFIFSNLLVFLSIIGVGYGVFNYRKLVAIDSIHKESFRILQEYKLRFNWFVEKKAALIKQYINSKNEIFQEKVWDKNAIEDLKHLARKLKANVVIYKGSGEFNSLVNKSAILTSRETEHMFRVILDFMNGLPKKATLKRYKDNNFIISYDEIIQDLTTTLNNIIPINLSTEKSWIIESLLGKSSSSKYWAVLLWFWESQEFSREFVKESIENYNQLIFPRKIIAFGSKDRFIFPQKFSKNKEIENFLRRTETRKFIAKNIFEIKNKSYIATSISGTKSFNESFLALFPVELVDKKIRELKFNILLMIIISSLLLYFVAKSLFTNMISPIVELDKAINQMKKGNFAYKITQISNDEFGELALTTNEAIENLNNLSIGTIIQKSLFPKKYFRNEYFELYADSKFMTKMGGDYFDYVLKENQYLKIFFGDVAGHGIPAGILMGMAKAAISKTQKDLNSPSETLGNLNDIFIQLKQSGWRRSMTCQSATIDIISGEMKIANAGQCYPILIDKHGNSADFINVTGFPMGTKLRKPYKEFNFQLEEGQTLILYSDGVIEAINSEREIFGYDRFKLLLKKSWTEDLQQYWTNIFNGYSDWAAEQDDDITFLIFRLKSGNKQHEN